MNQLGAIEAISAMVDMGVTRKQAMLLMDTVGSLNCEPTSRVMPDNDNRTEWSASISIPGTRGAELTAYYYTTPEDDTLAEDNGGDWGAIDWAIDHYTVY